MPHCDTRHAIFTQRTKLRENAIGQNRVTWNATTSTAVWTTSTGANSKMLNANIFTLARYVPENNMTV